LTEKEKSKKPEKVPSWVKKSDWNKRFDSKRRYPHILTPDRHDWISFGLIGDTHFVNNFCNEDAIRGIYRDFQNMGISQVFHCGDVWDGCTGYTQIYPGQIHDVPFLGFTRAVNYVAKNYPRRKGVRTAFILGNHDARVLEREGVDFGVSLAGKRDDLDYLQPYYARVVLSEEPPLTMDIVHLATGVPYTVGYAMQKYIRRVPPSKRANIYGFGHTHHHQHVSVEGDDESFLVGGFQEPNEYSIRRGKGSEIGGYKIRIKLDREASNPMRRMESTWLRHG